MNTLKTITGSPLLIPSVTAIYLSGLGEARGRQELYTRQSPQKLKTLREHALIESAVSSNRIEGVTIDRSRVATVVFGKSVLRDREEEEVRGYKEALKLIHDKGRSLPVSEETIKHLHSLSRGGSGDAGEYKTKNRDIIEKYPDGRERIRFKTVSAAETPGAMEQLVALWNDSLRDNRVPELVLLAAWTLTFCVYINYILYTLKTACAEFESRFSKTTAPRGSRRQMVEEAILSMKGSFTLNDIMDKCPGVSIDTVRKIFKERQKEGQVECLVQGRDAKWRVK